MEAPDDARRLVAILARLRDPVGGCAWDRQQTFASIAPYTIEEAYEVVEAIDRADMAALRDELGDLLLQVVFHARMAEEQGAFDFGDVVTGICDKMLRRHPHVFAGAATAPDWAAIKQAERRADGQRDASALAGIGSGLPEWQRARKLQARAAGVGFDWPEVAPVLDKLAEEMAEVRAEFDARAAAPGDPRVQARLQDEIGDVLFVAANLARHAGVDAGAALRGANRKFERRFRAMEALALAQGTSLASLSLDAQEALWRQVKQTEPGEDAGTT